MHQMRIVIQGAKSSAFIHRLQVAVTFILISHRDTAQTVKERFGKKLYESLLV